MYRRRGGLDSFTKIEIENIDEHARVDLIHLTRQRLNDYAGADL
jgi:hypothetical protein